MKKRTLLKTALATAILGMGIFSAQAADFPKKPINLWVAYKAGGGSDTMARQVASEIEKAKGWKIVVRNVTGAGGGVMLAKLKRAKPDGYTFGLATAAGLYLGPVLNPKARYQPTDFSYIGAPIRIQLAMVALSEHGWKNLSDMADYAKKNGGLNLAFQGPAVRRDSEKIAAKYGIDIRYIPIKGEAEGIAQVMGKHADIAVSSGAHTKYVESEEMVELALFTSERSPYSPDVQTVVEQGIENIPNNYFIFAMPKGVPADIRKQWAGAVSDAMQTEAVKKLAERLRVDIANPLNGEQTEAFLVKNYQQAKAEFAKEK